MTPASTDPDGPLVRANTVVVRHAAAHMKRQGATAGRRHCGDKAGKPDPAEVHLWSNLIDGELLVVPGVIGPEQLAVELVAPVHRGRRVELILAHASGLRLGLQ